MLEFDGIRLLCVGDLILDRFLYSDTDRISPEAPVPVLRLRQTRSMLGGAGNVARNVAALGGEAVVLGLLGDDPAGAEMRALLAAGPGLHCAAVAAAVNANARPTTCKARVIAAHQQVVRIDEEVSTPADPAEEDALCRAIEDWVPRCAGVILSDYAKGVLTERVSAFAVTEARRLGLPVFVDPKLADLGRYRGATCIKPNLKELALASGLPVEDAAQAEAAARRVIARAEVDAVLVTRAEKGMLLVEADGGAEAVPARAREVFDVSGAGDTAIAVATLAYAKGLGFRRAMRLANAASSLVVGKLGTATVTRAELAAALDDAPGEHLVGDGKVVGLDAAAAQVRRWQAEGLRVGVTNGCFDLLHAGHVSLLRQARAACDRLVVALNSDDSVRRLKGPSRPVNTLADRCTVMAALECVDLVLGFAEDTPLDAIQALQPDVLVKGADYEGKLVVGAELVTARGGQVVLAALVPGRSTTATIARMRDGGAG